MSAFRKFDPRLFRNYAESVSEPAKVAKPAKPPAADPSFSSFSKFSSDDFQFAKSRTSEAPTPDEASETAGWTREDWHAFLDERAGVAEFDGNLPRPQAEARAFECCIGEWLTRSHVPSQAGRCAWCNKREASGATVLPFGTEQSGHVWLHAECWETWRQARRAQAEAALAAVGLTRRPEPNADGSGSANLGE